MKLLDCGKLNQRQAVERNVALSARASWATTRPLEEKPTPGRPPKLTDKQEHK